MKTILEIVENEIKSINKYTSESGKILKTKIYSDVMTMDEELITLLASNDKIKSEFFKNINGMTIFDKQKFNWLIDSKEFLPDSYTKFSNKIGLSYNDNFFIDTDDVVLTFPYKDTILHGGQDKEDQKRDEIFFNKIISSEHITKMLEPKVLTKAKRYNKEKIENSYNFNKEDNLIIKGNNLIGLYSILEKYENSIKLIYIDPPYNTGGDANIFTYNNTFNHSTWLTFMKNRLEIAKKLLKEDGFIAIAIDHFELFYLGVIADEIFGKENRVGIVSVVHKPEGRNQEKFFSTSNEFMLVYAKDKSIAKFNEVVFDEDKRKEFKYSDEFDKYKLNNYLRSGGGDHNLRINKPHFYYPIYVDPITKNVFLEKKDNYIAVYPITSTGVERTWKTRSETFEDKLKDNRIVAEKINGQWQIFEKYYISENGQLVKTHWIDRKYNAIHNGTNLLEKTIGRRAFSYPKSLYLVKDTIELMTSKDDIILDFFAGSGTTGHATLLLNKEDKNNRKFILIEQLDEHIDICVERIHKVIQQEDLDEKFIYTEMLTNNINLINEIKNLSKDTISKFKNDILTSNDIVPYLTKEEIQEADKLFEDMSLEDKKKSLIDIIDKNKLYVNYSDKDDVNYKVDNQDIQFSTNFYEEDLK